MSLLQSKSGTGSNNNHIFVQFNGVCTTDSLLWGIGYWQDATKTASVTESSNGGWTALGSPLQGAGAMSGFMAQMFYKNHNVGTVAIDAQLVLSGTVTGSIGFAIHEYSPGTPTPGTPFYKNTNSANPVTDAATGAPLAAFCIAAGSVTTANSPFTQRENTNFGQNSTSDDVAGGSGVACTFADSGGAQDNIVGIVGFSSGGGASNFTQAMAATQSETMTVARNITKIFIP